MKPLITALVMCGLLFAPAPATAADDYTWFDAASSSVWENAGNWAAAGFGVEWPGQSDAADTATIKDDTENPVSYSTGAVTIASLTIDSNAKGETVQLSVTDSPLTVSGTTTLDADADGAFNATLLFNNTTDSDALDVGAFVIDGGEPDATHGQALFDYDSGTLADPASITFRGDAKIDAEADIDVVAAVTVETGTFATDAVIDMASTKTFTASSATISVIDNATSYNSMLTLQGVGHHVITNALTLNGTALANVEPTLVVSSTGNTVTFGTLDLNGGDSTSREAVLDINKSVTVGTASTMSGYVNIDVASSQTLDMDDLTIDGATTVLTLVTNTGNFDADSFLIDANTPDAARSFEKTGAGTLDVDGALTVDSGATSGSNATLKLTNGSITPDSMVLDGASSTAEAKLDLDQNFTVDSGNAHTAPDTTMRSFVEINVAGSTTANFKDTLYDADGTLEVIVGASGAFQTDEFKIQDAGANAAITVTKAGDGELSASSLVIVGGNSANEEATLTVSAGSIVTR